ncbi:MAG: QacE family quaternary ammonium compound efflux SMR transporter, partial [Spirochaetia bacterium]|nr:QacE family quaternary ammonium compound efflux SMR transporter [Spirochaetia bacterium]
MAWFMVILAGLIEIIFTSCLGKARDAHGSSAIFWYAGFLIALFVSLVLMIRATRFLPMGTAYAVWTGIGGVGTVIMGLIIFKEPAEFWRLFFIATL